MGRTAELFPLVSPVAWPVEHPGCPASKISLPNSSHNLRCFCLCKADAGQPCQADLAQLVHFSGLVQVISRREAQHFRLSVYLASLPVHLHFKAGGLLHKPLYYPSGAQSRCQGQTSQPWVLPQEQHHCHSCRKDQDDTDALKPQSHPPAQ